MRQEADAVTKWLSIGVVAIAVLLIARAVWQDVVIDEADTALACFRLIFSNWSPNPDNHLLNSLLARVSIPAEDVCWRERRLSTIADHNEGPP
ncbi:MAG TPA: hypothetical protein VKC99_08675 [Methyloceanibacter sp.]|jgi:hypothetical protein|nr:hypothetical protein [Methyloceanibacter sp.]